MASSRILHRNAISTAACALALLLAAGCSHAQERPQRQDLTVHVHAAESPMLRSFISTLVRHGVRVTDEPVPGALDLSFGYEEGPSQPRWDVIPRDGLVTLEVREGDKVLETLQSPDQFCTLHGATLSGYYACHADRLSYDFLRSDAARPLPGGPPPAPPQ